MQNLISARPNRRIRQRIVFLSAVLGACMSPPAGGPDAFVGCYAVRAGPWQIRDLSEYPAYRAPETILLDSIPFLLPEGEEAYRIVLRSEESEVYEFTYWKPYDSDSVRVALSTGYEGIEMTLQREPHALEGTAWAISDVPFQGRTPSREIRLVPIACPRERLETNVLNE